MAENDNLPVEKPEEKAVTPPVVTPPVVAPVAKDLTAADPGHEKYDPLKDDRVKVQSDKLFSRIAEKENENKSIKEILEATNEKLAVFEREKKVQDDKDKSEAQLASERITELEKANADLSGKLEGTKESNAKSIINLKAKLLLMEELNRGGIKTNAAERKGLQAELEDRLSNKKDTEEPSDIAKNIVADFSVDRESTYKAPAEPKATKPQKIVQTDDMKRLNELNKGEMTPEKEAESKEILQRMENKKKQ